MKTINFREVALSEIINLPVYPVADILPKLDRNPKDRESGKTKTLTLSELADSIVQHGQHEAIVLYHGQILDGRNRRWACEIAAKALGQTFDEFTVLVEDFEGTEEEADEFVFTAGLDRRDLEPTQRAMSAAKFEFEPATRPMFERMKEKAKLALSEAAQRTNAARWGEGDVASATSSLGDANVTEILSRRFRVSSAYIKEARRILREEQTAREAAERAQERARQYEKQETEAKSELEAAKETGNQEKVREASTKANNAALHKAEEREKVAEFVTKANSLDNLADALHEGRKKLSEVRKERKQSNNDEAEEAITKAASTFNKAYKDLMESGRFLLNFGRPNDQENVRLKFVRLCEEFGDIEPFEGVLNSEETRDYWAHQEAEAAEAGERRINTPSITVAQTKPCGCDFSGRMTCELCA